MAEVLELQSVRQPLQRAWLSAVKLPMPTHWALVDGTLGKTYVYRGIRSTVSMVARRRVEGVFVINLLEGRHDQPADPHWKVRTFLDSVVVERVLNTGESFIPCVVFDDGTHWELSTPATETRREIIADAVVALARRGLVEANTDHLAAGLSSRFYPRIFVDRARD